MHDKTLVCTQTWQRGGKGLKCVQPFFSERKRVCVCVCARVYARACIYVINSCACIAGARTCERRFEVIFFMAMALAAAALNEGGGLTKGRLSLVSAPSSAEEIAGELRLWSLVELRIRCLPPGTWGERGAVCSSVCVPVHA